MALTTPGAKNLITDVAGLGVGCAHDVDVNTGVTVIAPENPAVCAVVVAGGGPGTRETDALQASTLVDAVDALVLSGGSVYGLAAADGVAAALGAKGVGFGLMDLPGVPKSPIVPAAILYDLANGGDKAWGDAPPYRDLGAQALAAVERDIVLGASGAGYGARAGGEAGGLGSASAVSVEGWTVGALAAVNCFGATRMPGCDAFWAWPYEQNGEFGAARPPADFSLDLEDWGDAKANPAPRANTTIACIATDVALTVGEAQRVAQMALSGFSRAIRPVFAPFDGDVLFVMSTGVVEPAEPKPMTLARLGEVAAACLARSIARGVYERSRGEV